MKKIWFLLPLSYYVQVTQCQQQPASDRGLALSGPEWEASRKDHLFPISNWAKMCSEVHAVPRASLCHAQVIRVTSEIIFSKQQGSYNPYGTRLQTSRSLLWKLQRKAARLYISLDISMGFIMYHIYTLKHQNIWVRKGRGEFTLLWWINRFLNICGL